MRKPKIYCVYKHTNPFNNLVYIGITSNDPEVRWMRGYGYKSNKPFFDDIVKYGWKNIKHEIIFKGLRHKEALKIEHDLVIKQLNNKEYIKSLKNTYLLIYNKLL